MARIFQRGNNWGIDYSVNGVRKRDIIGPNKAIALLALKKKQILIAENKHLDVKRIPKIKFSEFSVQYIESYLKPNRPTTWHTAESYNIRHLNNAFGEKFLHEITSMDIEKFRQERLKVVGKNTVNKNVASCRAMFNKAIEWGLFEGRSPVSGIKFYKLDNRRLRFLEKEDIKRLLSHCEGHLKDIVEFAINTGMRRGEIFNLKWHDIDWNNGFIHLLKTKNNDKREIPLNENVRSILVRVKRSPDSPYVFSSFNGKAFVDIKKSFHTALKNAAIENFRFHDLRHTFASQLIMSGVDFLTVKELLGHKSIEMTLRYSHLSCDHKKRAVKVLDELNGANVAQPFHIRTVNNEIPNSYENLAIGFLA